MFFFCGSKKPHYSAEVIKQEMLRKTADAQYDSLIDYCHRIRCTSKSDPKIIFYATVMLGQTYAVLSQPDSIKKYLDEAVYWNEQVQDIWGESVLCNLAGIYAVDYESNYSKGISWFTKGLRISDSGSTEHSVLLINLSRTYCFRNDTAGLQYALEAYRFAQKSEDDFLKLHSALICADFYFQKKELQTALKYTEIADNLAYDKSTFCQTYTLYGKIMEYSGNPDKAEFYYQKAMDYTGSVDMIADIELYLNYGRYLMNRNQVHTAILYFNKALDLTDTRKSHIYRHLLYRNLAEAWRKLNDLGKALDYYQLYQNESDSLFNIEKEQSMNELRILYDTEMKEQEIHRKEVEILKMNQKMQFLIAVIILVLVAAGAAWLLYLRKSEMYRLIVRQYHEFHEKEKKYQEGLAMSNHEPETTGNDKREKELFLRVEQLMRSEQLYRDSGLTLENLAERLGTNRTYLSNTFNHYAGISFSSYVNKLRIDDAIKILSDCNNNIALKDLATELGFNTLSTFYRSFQSIVNMPPSRFRDENRKMFQTKE